ncbi:MAG: YIP1 family protein [Mariprofundales bacterium]|nr:YIP1 family protein [Mariprofundales bacterium]
MIYVDDARMLQTMVPGCLGVLRSPKEFFRAMPGSQLYRNSIMVLTFVSFLSVLVSMIFHAEAMLFLYPLVWVVMLIVLKLFETYLVAAVRSVTGRALAGSNAFRILTYASVPLALMFVPWLTMAAQAWALYLLWLGLVKRINVPAISAAVIVFLPGILLMVVGNVGVVMVFEIIPKLRPWL